MYAYVVSLIRTLVPVAVGTLLTWLAEHGLDVPADQRGTVSLAGVGIVATGYYVLVRALEKRWPKLGALLGVPVMPTYLRASAMVAARRAAAVQAAAANFAPGRATPPAPEPPRTE